jgi:hypothetical protein
MLEFDEKKGKELKDQSALGENSADWKAFGKKLWGTDDFKGVVDLAVCKVK